MVELFRQLELATSRDDNLLLLGETGTGKTVAAREIHRNGRRGKAPFRTHLSSDKDQTAFESELFGHEKGAYTDAEYRPGLFRTSDGGTVFFDEIGDMSIDSQKKLLRVVEEKRFTPLGSDEEIKVDVRIIVATNKDIEKLVKESKFKEDLFYRFEKHKIIFPALREHPEDIPLLINRISAAHSRFNMLPPVVFDDAAIWLMQDFPWPGNVRQLETVIEDAIFRSAGHFVVADDIARLLKSDRYASAENTSLASVVRRTERLHILSILERTDYNVSRAADLLGIDRTTLHRKIKELEINVRDLKNDH